MGALLRVYGLDFGLPHPQARPDEGVLLHRALSVASGDPNPHFFNYPSLHIYFSALAYGLYYLCLLGVGQFEGPSDLVARFVEDPSELYLVGRSLSVLMGTVTILACALLADRISGRRAAVVAAWLLSVTFLHVRDSHFLAVDIPATFWGCLAIALLCYRGSVVDAPRPWPAAVILGLAIATKYNLALFLPALVFAGFSRHPDSRSEGVREAASLLGIAAATFFLTSPFVVIDAGTFLEHLIFEAQHFGGGHGETLGNGWWYHLSVSLRHGLGLPLLLISLGGSFWLARTATRNGTIICLALLPYFLVSGAGNTLFVRYALPLVPLLCVAAASWIIHHTRTRPAASALITILVGSATLVPSIQHVSLLNKLDSRVVASRWIQSHLPGGTIAIAGSDYVRPVLQPTRSWLLARLQDVQQAGHGGRRLKLALDAPQAGGAQFDLLEVRSANPQNFRTIVSPDLDGLLQRGARWLLLPEHPLRYAMVDSNLLRQTAGLSEIWHLEVFSCQQEPVFDRIDAYFLPLASHGCVLRPGPGFRLFSLTSD